MSGRPRRFSARDRSGIALVIVLGFLALLTILVVAFAVMMRTERVAARSYQDVTKAKQMVWVGLARAQGSLDDRLGGIPLPIKAVYPPWLSTNSVGEAVGGTPPPAIDLNRTAALVDVSTNFPRSLAADFIVASNLQPALLSASLATWTNIVVDDVNNQKALVGRFAYVVVNDSGLVDANYAGGLQRGAGVGPAEISNVVSVFSELMGSTLANVRSNTYTRFESIPDLAVCARVSSLLNNTNRVANLHVFSQAPRGFWDASISQVRDAVYIGGDSASSVRLVATPGDIQAALTRSFAAASEAPNITKVYQNLVDYTDADDRPQDIASFATEAIPMINEVVIAVTSKVAGSGYQYEFTPRVELSFPFAGVRNTKSYSVRVGIQFEGAPSPATYKPPSFAPVAVSLPPPGGGWTQGQYYVTGPAFFSPAAAVSGDPATPPVSWTAFKARVICQVLDGSTALDQVGSGSGPLLIDMSTLTTAIGDYREFGMACNDPRFNYKVGDTLHWKPVGASPGSVGAHTLSNENVGVVTYATDVTADGTNVMYVRDNALTNSGELGFLAYDESKPWHTIRLLNTPAGNAHSVLDNFTIHSNAYKRGLINPNSYSTNVIMAAFVGAWTNFAPVARSNSPSFSAADAAKLARGVLANGPYVNRSELARVGAAYWPTGIKECDRESILRHAADLFSTRQNLFTFILAAQTIRREPGKAYDAAVDDATEVVAEQRAVAVVWRDPFPVNGSHEQKVVFFKWLSE